MPTIKQRREAHTKRQKLVFYFQQVSQKLRFIQPVTKTREQPRILKLKAEPSQIPAINENNIAAAKTKSPAQKQLSKKNKTSFPQLVSTGDIINYALLYLFDQQAIEPLAQACNQAKIIVKEERYLIQQVPYLLEYLVKGELGQAEAFLQKFAKETQPQAFLCLLTTRSQVTDAAGRFFEGITAFQYALWSLDRSMWEMLLEYLPKKIAALQMRKHRDEKHKPEYVKRHGQAFDCCPLIESIKSYLEYCAKAETNNRYNHDTASRLWNEGVIPAQHLLPVTLLNEYRQQRSNNASLYAIAKEDLENLTTLQISRQTSLEELWDQLTQEA